MYLPVKYSFRLNTNFDLWLRTYPGKWYGSAMYPGGAIGAQQYITLDVKLQNLEKFNNFVTDFEAKKIKMSVARVLKNDWKKSNHEN